MADVYEVPNQCRVFCNGVPMVNGKISFSEKGAAKSFKTFHGVLLCGTIADWTFNIEAPSFKSDALSVADATARALQRNVQFRVTMLEDGRVVSFRGKREGSDENIDPDNPSTLSRAYIITEPARI